MSVRCIQNSGEYRVSGAVDRVPSSERRGTVSSLRRITRIAPFSTLSKPDSGLILSLAKPPIGASRSSQRCELPTILATRTDALSPRMLRVIEDLSGDWRRLDQRIDGLSGEIE